MSKKSAALVLAAQIRENAEYYYTGSGSYEAFHLAACVLWDVARLDGVDAQVAAILRRGV